MLEPTAFQGHTEETAPRTIIRTFMSDPSPSKSFWAKLGFSRDGFIAWALRILPGIDRLLMRSAEAFLAHPGIAGVKVVIHPAHPRVPVEREIANAGARANVSARWAYSSNVSAISSGRSAAWSRLAPTRLAKLRPRQVSTGSPAQSASQAVE